jgi:hypothetical protein
MIKLSNATISKNNQQIAKEKRKAVILTMMGVPVMDKNMFEGRGGGGGGLEVGQRDGFLVGGAFGFGLVCWWAGGPRPGA